VLVCLCHLCNKFGVNCFLKGKSDDGLVFFGTALVFSARIDLLQSSDRGGVGQEVVEEEEDETEERRRREEAIDRKKRMENEGGGLRGILRAWTLNQLAFSYDFLGESDAALTALLACDAACEEVVAMGGGGGGEEEEDIVAGGRIAFAKEMLVVAEIQRMHVLLKKGAYFVFHRIHLCIYTCIVI